MASRPGRSRAFLEDRRDIRRLAFDIERAGDPTGSFFSRAVEAQLQPGEENVGNFFHNIYYATFS